MDVCGDDDNGRLQIGSQACPWVEPSPRKLEMKLLLLWLLQSKISRLVHQMRLVLCIVFIDIVGALAEAVLVLNFAESSLLGGLYFFLFK